MKERLRKLFEERAKLLADARKLLDENPGDKWTADLDARYKQMHDDAAKLAGEMRTIEAQIRAEEEFSHLAEREGRSVVTDPAGGPGEPRAVSASPEYRAAFDRYIRTGNVADIRAMEVTVDPSGGYFVPDEFHRAVVTALEEYLEMRRYATVLQTSSDRDIPVANMDGVAYWVGESKEFTESDETLAQVVLRSHKLGALQRISEELTQDSAFDIFGFLANAFALRFARAEEPAFTTGNGVGQPTGFMVDAEVGVTATDDTTIDPDEITDLFYSLKAPYRRRAIWQMADATMAEVSKLKDGSGRYIWNAALAPGDPDTIKGRPVVSNSSMADVGASAKPIAFGDFSFYWIGDRGSPIVQRLIEKYAEYGQVGFRMARRMDGKLTIPEAVKCMQMGAGS